MHDHGEHGVLDFVECNFGKQDTCVDHHKLLKSELSCGYMFTQPHLREWVQLSDSTERCSLDPLAYWFACMHKAQSACMNVAGRLG